MKETIGVSLKHVTLETKTKVSMYTLLRNTRTLLKDISCIVQNGSMVNLRFVYPSGRVSFANVKFLCEFFTLPGQTQLSSVQALLGQVSPGRVPSLEPQSLTICSVFTLISRPLVKSETFPTGLAKGNKAFSVTSIPRD